MLVGQGYGLDHNVVCVRGPQQRLLPFLVCDRLAQNKAIKHLEHEGQFVPRGTHAKSAHNDDRPIRPVTKCRKNVTGSGLTNVARCRTARPEQKGKGVLRVAEGYDNRVVIGQ